MELGAFFPGYDPFSLASSSIAFALILIALYENLGKNW